MFNIARSTVKACTEYYNDCLLPGLTSLADGSKTKLDELKITRFIHAQNKPLRAMKTVIEGVTIYSFIDLIEWKLLDMPFYVGGSYSIIPPDKRLGNRVLDVMMPAKLQYILTVLTHQENLKLSTNLLAGNMSIPSSTNSNARYFPLVGNMSLERRIRVVFIDNDDYFSVFSAWHIFLKSIELEENLRTGLEELYPMKPAQDATSPIAYAYKYIIGKYFYELVFEKNQSLMNKSYDYSSEIVSRLAKSSRFASERERLEYRAQCEIHTLKVNRNRSGYSTDEGVQLERIRRGYGLVGDPMSFL